MNWALIIVIVIVVVVVLFVIGLYNGLVQRRFGSTRPSPRSRSS